LDTSFICCNKRIGYEQIAGCRKDTGRRRRKADPGTGAAGMGRRCESVMGILPGKRSAVLDRTRPDSGAGLRKAEMIAGVPIVPVEVADGGFVIDAGMLGTLLDIAPADIPALMRARAITSLCERGLDADQGVFRLSFFYRHRQAQVHIDASGRVLRRSIIDLDRQGPPEAQPAFPVKGASPTIG
jgi:hypothetical protein